MFLRQQFTIMISNKKRKFKISMTKIWTGQAKVFFFCLLLSRHLVVARQGLHTRLVRSTNQTLNFLSFFNYSLSGSFAKNRGHFHLNDCTYLLKTRSGINTDEFWGHFAFLFWREIFQALNEVDSTNGQTVFNCALQVIQPRWDVKCITHFICSLC